MTSSIISFFGDGRSIFSTKKKAKSKNSDTYDDSGIILIDDDLDIDTEKVSEERKA